MEARLPQYFQKFTEYLTRVKYLRLPFSAALPDFLWRSDESKFRGIFKRETASLTVHTVQHKIPLRYNESWEKS